jgi:phage terminase small subunit
MPRTSSAALTAVPFRGDPDRDRLEPPASLGGVARETFVTVVGGTEPGHFHLSDLPLLCRYCEAVSLAKRCEEELARTLTVRGKPSPYVEILASAVRSIDLMATKLRLSPRARVASARSPRQQGPMSYYDRIAKMEP